MKPRIELLKAVVAAGLSENEALNVLQIEHGVVSDLCVKLSDVSDADCPRAIEVLNARPRKRQ